jgi:hypothetical protein
MNLSMSALSNRSRSTASAKSRVLAAYSFRSFCLLLSINFWTSESNGLIPSSHDQLLNAASPHRQHWDTVCVPAIYTALGPSLVMLIESKTGYSDSV